LILGLSLIYDVPAVSADQELMKLLKEEKITLRDAIRAAHNPQLKKEMALATSAEVAEVEKPKTEEISAGEERIEEAEPSSVIFEEIKPKKPRFEEIFQKAVELVEEKLQRPMNAVIPYLGFWMA